MRNITLSADEALIEEARALAKSENSTLNEQFRLWLEAYTRKQRVNRYRAVMDDLQGKIDTGGHKFTRDEMNER
jgi:hypothetical protein